MVDVEEIAVVKVVEQVVEDVEEKK